MRALVISDTHFGAWTGKDILREPEMLRLLEPWLDVDEVIFLGDMFDLLFGSLQDAFGAAQGLLDLLRGKLQGKRFVFLAGNHDHQFVTRAAEDLVALGHATDKPRDELGRELPRGDFFRRFLERNLEGVEVEIRYPTYTFAGVLCTHGHYLDVHASRSGGRPARLLGRTVWSIAVGGGEDAPTIEDYEATAALLTGLLYTIAQLPNGTHAQRRVFRAFQALERISHLCTAPIRAVEQLASWSAAHVGAPAGLGRHPIGAEHVGYQDARAGEAERRRRTGAPAGGEVSSFTFARSVRPSDPSEPAIEAFEQVVANLGWAQQADKIVFAHTHQPLDGVTGPAGAVRYWNTGSWIYEPDLRSRQAYTAYLKNAWPGTVVVIDSREPQPRLIRLCEPLNPLHRGDAPDEPAGPRLRSV